MRMIPQTANNTAVNQKVFSNKKTWKTPVTLSSTCAPSAPLPLPSTSLLATTAPNYVGLVNQAMTCYLNSLLQVSSEHLHLIVCICLLLFINAFQQFELVDFVFVSHTCKLY